MADWSATWVRGPSAPDDRLSIPNSYMLAAIASEHHLQRRETKKSLGSLTATANMIQPAEKADDDSQTLYHSTTQGGGDVEGHARHGRNCMKNTLC